MAGENSVGLEILNHHLPGQTNQGGEDGYLLGGVDPQNM